MTQIDALAGDLARYMGVTIDVARAEIQSALVSEALPDWRADHKLRHRRIPLRAARYLR